MKVGKIFERTVWDTDEQHRIWCNCGKVFTGETAMEVQDVWREHQARAVVGDAR